MKRKVFFFAGLAVALTGCAGSGPDVFIPRPPRDLADFQVDRAAEFEAARSEERGLPTDGTASYFGLAAFAYGAETAPGEGAPDDVTAMLGEMRMRANFSETGGTVTGDLTGFVAASGAEVRAATGVDPDAVEVPAVLEVLATGNTDWLNGEERQAVLATFDGTVSGRIDLSGDIAATGAGFPVGLVGSLQHEGKTVAIGGNAEVGFEGAEANFVWINSDPDTPGGMALTEDGAARSGVLVGVAGQPD